MSTEMEIMRAGRHVSVEGREVEVTAAHLAAVAARYVPAEHEAPLVVGHPALDAPAYGWVAGLRAEGDVLLAQAHQVDPEFAELVAAGRYKKRSAAFYGSNPAEWRLRHVGFLGAQPPAVKGLKDVSFAAGEGFEAFTDSEDSEETHDHNPHTQGDEMDPKELEKQLADEKTARAEAERKAKEAEAKAEAVEAKFAEAETKRKGAERAARFEKLLAGGKAMPGEKAAVLAFAESLEASTATTSFAEGGAPEPLAEAYWKWLESRPGHEMFAELSPPIKGGEPLGDLTKHA